MRRRSVWLIVGILLLVMPLVTGAASSRRSYAAGHFFLMLDGVLVGELRDVEGGHAVGDVVTERLGPDLVLRKHIGAVKYEDITMKVNLEIEPALRKWVADWLQNHVTRKNGAIIATDFDYNAKSYLDFFNATIVEIGMPALDAASKDPAYLILKLRPEYARHRAAAGEKVAAAKATQKKWLPANFRFRLGDLPASRISKVEALTIKRSVAEGSVGESRDYEIEPSHLEIPNLVITLAESHAKPLYDWHADFVSEGRNAADQEKSATLEFLSPNGKDLLFSLTFKHLGIFRLAPAKAEAGAEPAPAVKAEMYCEEVAL